MLQVAPLTNPTPEICQHASDVSKIGPVGGAESQMGSGGDHFSISVAPMPKYSKCRRKLSSDSASLFSTHVLLWRKLRASGKYLAWSGELSVPNLLQTLGTTERIRLPLAVGIRLPIIQFLGACLRWRAAPAQHSMLTIHFAAFVRLPSFLHLGCVSRLCSAFRVPTAVFDELAWTSLQLAQRCTTPPTVLFHAGWLADVTALHQISTEHAGLGSKLLHH